ncbi:DUF6544 family protein [Bacillus solimangrovi]|uniref:Uncharacterized protein n=1 Tax=Bacillus solimangrovi TaxID=1305675 RepID=A0A1E5LE07_9BACI|nr:DUF6544 family protein [Bacillus solimangrovi]OEH92331.1 hypothetical protein BFG57_16275 [Bacillus solimangrovi]
MLLLQFICFILVILVTLLIIIVFVSKMKFQKNVKHEIDELLQNKKQENEFVKEQDIKRLPPSVRRWLKYAQIVNKQKIKTVHVYQNAIMRLKPAKAWMTVSAQQYFNVDEPGFIWNAKIKVMPFVHIAGRDRYYSGRGNMLIKLLSFITVANSKGEEMDQGTLLRFLAETVWFPSAALSSYISWDEIDFYRARATMEYKGVKASGIFTFNDKGEVIKFEADRFMEDEGEYKLRPWIISLTDYKQYNGIKVPNTGEVTWKLETEDFTWFKFDILEIEYNEE